MMQSLHFLVLNPLPGSHSVVHVGRGDPVIPLLCGWKGGTLLLVTPSPSSLSRQKGFCFFLIADFVEGPTVCFLPSEFCIEACPGNATFQNPVVWSAGRFNWRTCSPVLQAAGLLGGCGSSRNHSSFAPSFREDQHPGGWEGRVPGHLPASTQPQYCPWKGVIGPGP